MPFWPPRRPLRRLPLRLLMLETREVPAGVPALHSLPSAPLALYMDFDGYSSGTTTYTPYSEDSISTDFNATEVANITECWRQVSTYYAAFNVDVTTEFTAGKPTGYLMVTGSVTGGYAYVNTVGTSGSPTGFNPSGDARTRESGIAHEFGHILGLQHQSDFDLLGVETADYSSGYDYLHGPIMGVDYAKNVHKFITGHTSNASGLQDDVTIIAAKVHSYEGSSGDGFRTDDYGNTIAAATSLPFSNGTYSVGGIVERLTDSDAFNFTAFGGTTVIDLVNPKPSFLDPKLDIYDAAGTLVLTADADGTPTSSSATNDQHLTLTLPAGVYFAVVSSHGDYSDLGMYSLTIRSLPGTWTSADVGSVGVAGSAGGGDTVTLNGSGVGLGGTADEFRLAYQRLTGDGGVSARVTELTTTAANRRAGVTLREGTGSNLKMVSLVVSGSNGVQLISRNGTGSAATTISYNPGTAFAPEYLRLNRTANTVVGEVSDDGIVWNTVGSVSVNLGTTPLVGLLVTSADDTKLARATFDQVTFTGAISPGIVTTAPANLPQVPDLTATLGSNTDVNLTWSDIAGETGYSVERSPDGVTWTAQATLSAGMTAYTAAGLAGSQRWFFRVAGTTSAGTKGPYADVASVVNRPSATPSAYFEITSYTTSQLVLDWRDVAGDTGYRIERSADGGTTWTTLGTVAKNVPSYTATGLATGTPYSFRVTPLSTQGDGVTSAVKSRSTRLASVTGLSVTGRTATSIALSWTALAGATNYRVERSADKTTWTSLGNSGGTTTFTNTGLTSTTEYYYRVFALSTDSESAAAPMVFASSTATTPVSAPWSDADIGAVGGQGAASFANNTFTVLAAGAGITGTADELHFVSQPLNGNGDVIAQVTTVEATNAGARAGVMIRASSAANAQNLLLAVTPSGGVVWTYRTSTGGTTATGATVAALTAPIWLKISRSGNSFTAYRSADGVVWTQVGSAVTIALPTTALAGLAVSSLDDTVLNRSTFMNVFVTDTVAPTVSGLTVAPTGPTNVATLTFTASFSESVTGVAAGNFALTSAGLTGATIQSVAGSGSSWTISVAAGSGAGTLQLRLANATGIADLAGNALTGTLPTNGPSVNVDRQEPTVTGFSVTPSGSTNAASIVYNLAFSEQVTGLDTINLTLVTTGTPNATIGSVSGSGTAWAVMVNLASGGVGSVQLRLAHATNVIDAVGNTLVGIPLDGPVVNVDRLPPSVQAFAVDSTGPTRAASVVYSVVFNEAVTGVSLNSFNLTTTGLLGATIQSVAGTGATRLVTVTTGSGAGTLRLNFGGTGVIDALGNAATTTSSGPIVSVDRLRPTLATWTILAGDAETVTWGLTFNEPVLGLTASNFQLSADGSGRSRILSVTGSGTTWQLMALVRSSGSDYTVTPVLRSASNIVDAVGNVLDGVLPLAGPTFTRPRGS